MGFVSSATLDCLPSERANARGEQRPEAGAEPTLQGVGSTALILCKASSNGWYICRANNKRQPRRRPDEIFHQAAPILPRNRSGVVLPVDKGRVYKCWAYIRIQVQSFHHNREMAPEIVKKQITHSITGPDAPWNLKPSPSNSIFPVVISNIETTNKAATAARGKPIAAAKCALATSIIHLSSLINM